MDPHYRPMTNPPCPLCSVKFLDARGACWMTNVQASSLFAAARAALDFFRDPFWRGPKPKPDTVLEISPMGRDESFRVLVSRVLEAARNDKRPA